MTMSQAVLTILPLIALLVNVIMQVIFSHLTHRIKLSILVGFICGLITNLSVLSTSIIKYPFSIEDRCISLLTYIGFAFCYWAFLNLNLTSLRIRIARELLKNKSTGLSMPELLLRYSSQELITRRLERLEASGQIVQHNGRWQLKSKTLLLFVFVSVLLRRIIIPKFLRA